MQRRHYICKCGRREAVLQQRNQRYGDDTDPPPPEPPAPFPPRVFAAAKDQNGGFDATGRLLGFGA